MSHSSTARAGGRSSGLILTAMIFAVAMTFIDQTIVSIAAPTIQHNLGLSSSGRQWAINAYLLTLAGLFAFGGRLADIAGHRKMVILGVIIFAGSSALCGATPAGAGAEAAGGVPRGARREVGRSCSRPRSPSWWSPSTCTRAARRWRCSSASPAR